MSAKFPQLNEQKLRELSREELQKKVKDWHYMAELLDYKLKDYQKKSRALEIMDRFRFN